MKKISIVTVTYNCEATIENTLLSVINQDYECLEYVIIDGKSTDKTLSIIEPYKDKIQKIVSEKDNGIFDAMNKSLKYITGEYVLFMNAGDIFVNNHVVSDIFKTYNGDDDLIYGDDYVRNDLGYMFRKASAIYQTSFNRRDLVFKSQGFSHQSLFTKVESLKEIQFNLKYPLGADYDTTWQIFELNHKIKYVHLPISVFDDLEGGASHKKSYMYSIIEERLSMFSYHLTLADKFHIMLSKYKTNMRYRLMELFPKLSAMYRNRNGKYINNI